MSNIFIIIIYIYKYLKERIENIDKLKEKQNVSNLNENSTDIFGYVANNSTLYIQIFKMNGGSK